MKMICKDSLSDIWMHKGGNFTFTVRRGWSGSGNQTTAVYTENMTYFKYTSAPAQTRDVTQMTSWPLIVTSRL